MQTARWDGQSARPTPALAWALPERGRELVMVIVVAMAMAVVVTMMVVAAVLMVVVVVVFWSDYVNVDVMQCCGKGISAGVG